MRFVIGLTRGYRIRIALLAMLGLAGVAAALAFVWLTKLMVDIAIGDSPASLSASTAALVGVLLVQILLSGVSRRLDTGTFINFSNSLRSRLFSHVMRSEWSGKELYHSADVVSRLEGDVATVSSFLCSALPSVVTTLARLAGAFIFLVVLSWKLAIAVVMIMPLAILVSKVYMGKSRKLTREIRDTDSRLQSTIQENVRHRLLVATMLASSKAADNLGSLQGKLLSLQLRRTRINIFSRSMITAGFMAGYCVTFLWCVGGLQNGTVTFGMMTAFLQLVSMVQRPVVELSQKVPAFMEMTVATDRLRELLDLPTETSGKPELTGESTGLRLENVTFRYPDGDGNVIDGLSYDFRPGSVTVIKGETGAGKTTFLRLLLGLLRPVSGRITIYGDRGEYVVSPLTRGNFSYIPQGNSLMTGTIRDNLRQADSDASEEKMMEALHTAAADFVAELPEGLDTLCGEGGAGLSEGQAQRIAIARGLLQKGNVMLLDEPTAALDPETASLLMRRLDGCVSGKTMIVVTHRPVELHGASTIIM